jgi:hypothetical protein
MNRRYRLSRHKLFEIDVAGLLGRKSLQLLIGHDHVLVFIDLITAHYFINIEIPASAFRIVLSCQRTTIWSKHAQRRTTTARGGKQIHRYAHKTKRKGPGPKGSGSDILLFG